MSHQFYLSILILLCAFSSAVWNLHVKQSDDKLTFVTLMVVPQLLIAIPIMLFVPIPSLHALNTICISALLQTAYIIFVTQSYHHGLINRVYPLTVGLAPLISLFIWHELWGSPLSKTQHYGVLLLSCGIIGFTFVEKHPLKGFNAKAIAYAIGTSFFIFGYSTVDTIGIHQVKNPLSYISWLFTIKGLLLLIPIFIFYLKMNYKIIFLHPKNYWIAGLLAGLGYSIAIWAFLYSPTAIILALRSTSVIFVFMLSLFLLKEEASIIKIILTIAILLGIYFVLI